MKSEDWKLSQDRKSAKKENVVTLPQEQVLGDEQKGWFNAGKDLQIELCHWDQSVWFL